MTTMIVRAAQRLLEFIKRRRMHSGSTAATCDIFCKTVGMLGSLQQRRCDENGETQGHTLQQRSTQKNVLTGSKRIVEGRSSDIQRFAGV